MRAAACDIIPASACAIIRASACAIIRAFSCAIIRAPACAIIRANQSAGGSPAALVSRAGKDLENTLSAFWALFIGGENGRKMVTLYKMLYISKACD
jgi:hypothetical protein